VSRAVKVSGTITREWEPEKKKKKKKKKEEQAGEGDSG
jgi:hypothetical protein